VFVDAGVHLGTAQIAKDEELRSLLTEERIQNTQINATTLLQQKKRDQLYEEIGNNLDKLAHAI